MPKSLLNEIKQRRPFESLEQEAFLNLMRTAAILDHEVADMLKAHEITPAQMNVLRILRGAGAEGLCRSDIAGRLITPVPDVTRLLDRLEEAGLVARERGESDRRMVVTRITHRGLGVLSQLDAPLAALHRRQLGQLGAERLGQLVELLAAARERKPAEGRAP